MRYSLRVDEIKSRPMNAYVKTSSMRLLLSRKQQLVLFTLLLAPAIIGWIVSPDLVLSTIQSSTTGVQLYVLLVVLYLVRPFVLWPMALLSVTVGYLFGSPLGIVIALAGTVVTCLPPYLLARPVRGRDWDPLARLVNSSKRAVEATGGVRGMTAARLSPASADAVSYGAGLSDVSLGAYVLGTVLGEIPWAVFYVTVGTSLESLTSTGDMTVNYQLLVAASIVAFLLVARPLYEEIWIE